MCIRRGTENGEGSEEEGEEAVTRWDVAGEDASDTQARGQGIEMEVEAEVGEGRACLRACTALLVSLCGECLMHAGACLRTHAHLKNPCISMYDRGSGRPQHPYCIGCGRPQHPYDCIAQHPCCRNFAFVLFDVEQ
jgi:hypothetical protein